MRFPLHLLNSPSWSAPQCSIINLCLDKKRFCTAQGSSKLTNLEKLNFISKAWYIWLKSSPSMFLSLTRVLIPLSFSREESYLRHVPFRGKPTLSYLCVMSMLLCRLKEESKWSQSYYAYLCGGEFFRTATRFQLTDFMGTFRGVDDFVQENERVLQGQKTL